MTDNASDIRISIAKPEKNGTADDFYLALDVVVPGKGVTAIFGPSGSGKTTLLRWIAGLQQNSDSHLSIKGQCWQKTDFFLAPHQRNLGYVFQEASLFPHLTVEQNIRYGLKRRKTELDQGEYQRILQVLDIEPLLTRMPEKLSGGERQRVAIARALVTKPRLLLMDEPLASLDDGLKQQILPYLEQLKQLADIPILYVTHSMQEVSRLADHVVVLQQGEVVAQGSINEVFSQQLCGNNDYVGTVIDVVATDTDDKWHLTQFSFGDNHLWLANTGEQLQQHYRLRIPASDVSICLTAPDDSSILNRLNARVTNIKPCENQANCLVKLSVAEQTLVAQITQKSVSQLQLREGMEVWVQIKSAALIR